MTTAKAVARHFYATVPGLATTRFALKELTTRFVSKPEYGGLKELNLNNSIIIDVGANRGHSINAFRHYTKNCHVIAFEPGPGLNMLRRRFSNVPKVDVMPYALGANRSTLSLFVPIYGRWECDGMAATSVKGATEWLADPNQMFRFNSALLRVKRMNVPMYPLDDFQLAPSLIKLHAQGAELDILKGATATISQHQPAIMCAFPTLEVVAFLNELGYSPFFYKNGFRPGFERKGTFTWFLKNN